MLGLSRASYYRWRLRPVADAEITEAYRANALFTAHARDPKLATSNTWAPVADLLVQLRIACGFSSQLGDFCFQLK